MIVCQMSGLGTNRFHHMRTRTVSSSGDAVLASVRDNYHADLFGLRGDRDPPFIAPMSPVRNLERRQDGC